MVQKKLVCYPAAMEQYLALVFAGFTGSVTMITCTVLALTRLVFEYKGRAPYINRFGEHVDPQLQLRDDFCLSDTIEVTTMGQLLHNICLLLMSRTREIVKAALGFIKVILFIMDPKTLASHATVMVGIVRVEKSRVLPVLSFNANPTPCSDGGHRKHSRWCEETLQDQTKKHLYKVHQKVWVRYAFLCAILVVLGCSVLHHFVCCSFRFEMVKSMLPPEHHKVLANIRKAEARSKRKKLASEEQEESESEAEVPKAKSQRWSTVLGIGPLSPSYFYNSFFHLNFLSALVLRTFLLSRTAIYLRMKERLRRRWAEHRKEGPGSKKGREMIHSTSWIPKFPREFYVRLIFICKWKHSYVPWCNIWCVLATNPARKKSGKVEHGFKVTSDGRLIIRDDDEEDAGDKGKTGVGWLYLFSEYVVTETPCTFLQITERWMISWKKLESRVWVHQGRFVALAVLIAYGCSCFNLFGPSEKDAEKEVPRWQLWWRHGHRTSS